jgi:hypothetical protein
VVGACATAATPDALTLNISGLGHDIDTESLASILSANVLNLEGLSAPSLDTLTEEPYHSDIPSREPMSALTSLSARRDSFIGAGDPTLMTPLDVMGKQDPLFSFDIGDISKYLNQE